MPKRRTIRARETQLAFEALSIEGGLIAADWLARIAQLGAPGQSEADYRIPKGLNLRDEIGRYWRMAQASWADFARGTGSGGDPRVLAEAFVLSLLRGSFGFASLENVGTVSVGDRTFPIGHAALRGRVPLVIAPAGNGVDAAASAFGDGTRKRSAFGLTQELLNATDDALWGFATDGMVLRILRDNASLTRPAWIEADLARIFTEERYADFAALWLLCHETRFGVPGTPATDAALETWRNAGREEGTRARDQLRRGVEDALVALGGGFLAHPDNVALRSALETGTLTKDAFFQELLRLVYRTIFLLTAEERDVLHAPGASDAAKKLYAEGYGMRRLRDRSARRSAHDHFGDVWEAFKIVLRGLARGEARLGLPALGGLFDEDQCPSLDAAKLENRALLQAVFRLSWIRDEGSLARVNWRDMGPEELGSVYESLLELVPQVTEGGRRFGFAMGAETKGNARKTTGSYYTPDSLVQVLLDSALEPVVVDTLAKNPEKPVEALLGLSIVDPACGSGHFLLSAARRLAAHVARLEANGTPSAEQYRHALRRVVGRCIFGVDLNPMAVELCKVSLWMEAIEPGRPLSFLDSHIQHGNALLGATPELLAKGIPDVAWEPIEGDDKKIAAALKQQNKEDAKAAAALPFDRAPASTFMRLSAGARAVDDAQDESLDAVEAKERTWRSLVASGAYGHQRFVADLWCAAFVWRKEAGQLRDLAPADGVFRALQRDGTRASRALRDEVSRLADQYSFFHWHLAFPQVTAKGGFDVVLGNPPWESLEVDDDAPAVHRRLVKASQLFFAASGLYRWTGKGRKNLYALFVERSLTWTGPVGRAGVVVPTELIQAAETEALSRELFRLHRVHSLCDFQNRRDDGVKWFAAVHPQYRFSLLTLAHDSDVTRFAFDAQAPEDLFSPSRGYTQSATDVLAFCGRDAFRVPMFFNPVDARLMARAYSGATILSEVPSDVLRSGLMFNFGQAEKERKIDARAAQGHAELLPVLEGENVHQFDHRFATLSELHELHHPRSAAKTSPDLVASTATYLPHDFVLARIEKMCALLPSWLLVLRRQARANDAYICIAAIVPLVAAEGSLTVFSGDTTCLLRLVALFNSFIMNYILARRQSGPNVNKGIYGLLPIRFDGRLELLPSGDLEDFVRVRVLELAYTAWDLEGFGSNVGYSGPPFRWSDERRFLLRCEIDAAFFHLYGLSRDDAAYVMDTFPIVRKNDEKAHGDYRTKRVILETYDAMAEAIRRGKPYVTRLDPPPADPRVAHPPRTEIGPAKGSA